MVYLTNVFVCTNRMCIYPSGSHFFLLLGVRVRSILLVPFEGFLEGNLLILRCVCCICIEEHRRKGWTEDNRSEEEEEEIGSGSSWGWWQWPRELRLVDQVSCFCRCYQPSKTVTRRPLWVFTHLLAYLFTSFFTYILTSFYASLLIYLLTYLLTYPMTYFLT